MKEKSCGGLNSNGDTTAKKVFVLLAALALAGSPVLAATQIPSPTPPPSAKTNRDVKPPAKPQIVTPATTTAQSTTTAQTKNEVKRPRHQASAYDGKDARKNIAVEVNNQNAGVPGKAPVVVGFADGSPDKPSNVRSAAQTHAAPSPTPTPGKRGNQPRKK